MSGLGLLRRFNYIKAVLVLAARVRILRRVQDLLLPLKLLLEHYLGLLLTRTGAAVLQGLRVSSAASLTVALVNGSRPAPIVLGRFVADHLMLQLKNIAGLGRRRHRQRGVVLQGVGNSRVPVV